MKGLPFFSEYKKNYKLESALSSVSVACISGSSLYFSPQYLRFVRMHIHIRLEAKLSIQRITGEPGILNNRGLRKNGQR